MFCRRDCVDLEIHFHRAGYFFGCGHHLFDCGGMALGKASLNTGAETDSLPALMGKERRAKSGLYELLFTASFDLAKTISDTSRMAPMTIALSATLKAGQW